MLVRHVEDGVRRAALVIRIEFAVHVREWTRDLVIADLADFYDAEYELQGNVATITVPEGRWQAAAEFLCEQECEGNLSFSKAAP